MAGVMSADLAAVHYKPWNPGLVGLVRSGCFKVQRKDGKKYFAKN